MAHIGRHSAPAHISTRIQMQEIKCMSATNPLPSWFLIELEVMSEAAMLRAAYRRPPLRGARCCEAAAAAALAFAVFTRGPPAAASVKVRCKVLAARSPLRYAPTTVAGCSVDVCSPAK